MNVLIDTNVMLDYLCQRSEFCETSNKIMEMCADEKFNGYIAAHSVLNAYYILRREYGDDERRRIILKYLDIVGVVSVTRENIEKCLSNIDFKDMEDCLQDECAASCGAEYIVTRNIKDFPKSKIKAVLPEEFIKIVEN